MTKLKRGVLEIRIAFETTDDNYPNTEIHIVNVVSDQMPKVRNTDVAFAAYDVATGKRIRKTEFTDYSPEMRRLIDLELGSEDPPEATSA